MPCLCGFMTHWKIFKCLFSWGGSKGGLKSEQNSLGFCGKRPPSKWLPDWIDTWWCFQAAFRWILTPLNSPWNGQMISFWEQIPPPSSKRVSVGRVLAFTIFAQRDAFLLEIPEAQEFTWAIGSQKEAQDFESETHCNMCISDAERVGDWMCRMSRKLTPYTPWLCYPRISLIIQLKGHRTASVGNDQLYWIHIQYVRLCRECIYIYINKIDWFRVWWYDILFNISEKVLKPPLQP